MTKSPGYATPDKLTVLGELSHLSNWSLPQSIASVAASSCVLLGGAGGESHRNWWFLFQGEAA